MTIDGALLALTVELQNWPGLVLEEIGCGNSVGGEAPNGEVGPMYPLPGVGMRPGPWESLNTDWWYVIVAQRQGWQHLREHYQGSGATILEAIEGLTTELVSRRTDPHRWHVSDWMQESRFEIGCADCEREAAELFDGEVEWTPA